jgi:hypothetical protein
VHYLLIQRHSYSGSFFKKRCETSSYFLYGFSFLWLLFFLFCGSAPGQSGAATSTSLVVSSNGQIGTSISSGSAVVLTASVTAGTTPVKTGQVDFCDATALYCTDIHLLGTAQLTSAGIASLTLRSTPGSYHWKAVFLATPAYSTSESSTSAVTVTGSFPTVATIAQSGSPGDYSLTATVSASAKSLPAPTGEVSFLDTSNSSTLLGTADLGNGVLAPKLVNVGDPQTGSDPTAIVAGDFNGDGYLDLAVAVTEPGQTVSILLGDGRGNFTQVTKSLITANGVPELVQDFNGDGIPDLLLSSQSGSSTITVLLGNEDGTFRSAPHSPFTTLYGDSPMVAADFNGDGIPDFAAAGAYYLVVFLGNGDGTFTQVPIGSSSIYEAIFSSMVVGDLNGDGIPDIAALDLSGETVSIFLGKGDGTFTQGSTVTTSTLSAGSTTSLTIGDFNGDGKLDLAVPVYDSSGSVLILLGNGDGTFQFAPQGPIPVESFPNRVAVGDFNGDGIADLLVAAQTSGTTLDILLGKGDGTFSQMATGSLGLPCCSDTVLGDFNGDGVTDVVSSDYYNSAVQVLFGTLIQSSATVTTIAPSAAGTHLVDASYLGDTNFGSTISATTSLQAQAAMPTFSPVGGTYPSTQTVSISDSSPGVTIYYTTDGSTPSPNSPIYSGPITVLASETINSIAMGGGYVTSPVATAFYAIVPPPQLTSLTPPFTSAGGASFTLTLNGSGFVPASTIYWGSTAAATQYVSATQLTAQITAPEIASPAITAVTVQSPASGGGTSNALQFEVDSADSGTPPTFTSPTATVAAGSIATYTVTLPVSATAVTATCLNLPAGAACSYSATTSTLSITTNSTTPSGTYQITVVFDETLPGVASALTFLPVLLLPTLVIGRKRTKMHFVSMLCLGMLLTIGTVVGCGGSGGSGGSNPQTHQITSSGSVMLVVN